MSGTRMSTRALAARTVLLAILSVAAVPGASMAQPGSLCNTPGAPGATPQCDAAASLPVFNSQPYALAAGASTISKIVGATDLTGSETCTGGSPGVDVIIKSSFGNQTVCGALSDCPGANCTITFSYTAPNGPDVCACMTSIVAYKTTGNNSSNDIIADTMFNGMPNGPAGFGYVDTNGQPIDTCGCPTTTTTSTTSSTTSTTTSTTT